MHLGLSLGFTSAYGSTILSGSHPLMESGSRIILESGNGFTILEN